MGLANYFKDNIKNYSEIMRPLNNLLKGYVKGKPTRIEWDEDTNRAYEDIKDAITNCPTLFFTDPYAKIFLHTDASDYGIRAYLWQDIDGKEQAVAFISKSLSRAQKRWHTPQKEAFTIFYSV